jgi:tetratricopeptide (TPR) repeat protein
VTDRPITERTVFLQRSIDDLDAEHAAGDLSDEDHADLKARYTAALGRESVPTPGTEPHPRHGRKGRGVAVVVAVLVVAGLAGGLVAQMSGERVAGTPSSGSIDEGSNDKLARAQQLVQQGRVLDAVKQYDAVLRADPKNPVALAQRGWVIRNAGLVDDGLTYIDRAIAADPNYPEAHFFRAMILWRDKGDPAAGVAEFRIFLASTSSSEDAAQVQPLLDQALAEAEGRPSASTTTVP